jgi:tetratricopeptide (TPR) repeat protein
MRKLLETINKRLQGFVDQNDDVALAVGCDSADAAPVIKIIEDLEAESVSEWYWVFKLDFDDPAKYASAIVSDFSTRHEAVRLSLEKEGAPPWPAIPDAVLSEENAPERRLRELMAFSRRLLPAPNGGAVVWVFFPINIANPPAFLALMKEVMRHEFPFPWCHHLRLILHDDLSEEGFKDAVERSPRWQWYKPDLSVEAVERSLAEEAADENRPLDERMNALMVMAGMDYSYQRYAGALDKYHLLLKYHAGLGNLPMAAFALNGIGEVYHKLGAREEAGRYFETALIPASSGEHPPIPVFLNVVLNLANLRLEQQRWQEAEGYYDAAQNLATMARNGPVKIRALENRGYSQSMQGKNREAIESWEQGMTLAESLGEESSRRSLLNRLSQAYRETNQVEKHRKAESLLVAPIETRD